MEENFNYKLHYISEQMSSFAMLKDHPTIRSESEVKLSGDLASDPGLGSKLGCPKKWANTLMVVPFKNPESMKSHAMKWRAAVKPIKYIRMSQ